MSRILVLTVLGLFMFSVIGCEAHSKADKEGVKVEVEKK